MMMTHPRTHACIHIHGLTVPDWSETDLTVYDITIRVVKCYVMASARPPANYRRWQIKLPAMCVCKRWWGEFLLVDTSEQNSWEVRGVLDILHVANHIDVLYFVFTVQNPKKTNQKSCNSTQINHVRAFSIKPNYRSLIMKCETLCIQCETFYGH